MKCAEQTPEQWVAETARMLYLRLPWWKRALFRKWYKSNNWDVKHIYERCIDEAKSLAKENERLSTPN